METPRTQQTQEEEAVKETQRRRLRGRKKAKTMMRPEAKGK